MSPLKSQKILRWNLNRSVVNQIRSRSKVFEEAREIKCWLPASLLFDDSLASCESFANMSAKYYGTTHRHPFKWDDVASAIFMRYPNPLATHVLTEDTLYREIRGGVLYSRRFLTKTNRLPKWGERFFSNLKKFVPLVEESHVDPKSRVV